MSYDVHVNCHTCGEDLMGGRSNMTSNVSAVWTEAGAPLRDWGGKTACTVLPALQAAIHRLSDIPAYEREEWTQMVRGDGSWGTVDSAREFLTRIRDACCRDPFATLSVSH